VALDLLHVVFSSRPAFVFGAICSHAESFANSVERAGKTQYLGFEVIITFIVFCAEAVGNLVNRL